MSTTVEAVTLSDIIADLCTKLEALPSSKRLSDADIDVIYANAYSLVTQGRHADALRRFSVLTLYRPTEARYLAGLAYCNQQLGRYDEAIANFAFAAHVEPDNPEYMLSVAECEILKHSFGEASDSLNRVIRYCREKGGLDKTLQRAEGMLALIDTRGNPA